MTATSGADVAAEPRGLRRRAALAALLLVLVPVSTRPAHAAPAGTAACTGTHWVGSWSASPSDASVSQSLTAQTARMVLAPHLAGSQVRLHLSNRFGHRPVTLGPVSLGVQQQGAAVEPGTLRAVLFGGHRTVVVPAGADAVSDTTSFTVRPFQHLTVSLAVLGAVATPTEHAISREIDYVSDPGSGDRTRDASPSSFSLTTTKGFTTGWYFLDALDVLAPARVGSVVALGASTTDGVQAGKGADVEDLATAGAEGRWPDALQRRLAAAGRPLSTQNAGISGNRVLADGLLPQYGPSALSRFDTDVLARSGVTDVVTEEGINDLGQVPGTTAQELVDGFAQLVQRAHTHGLRIQLGTLTPDGGDDGPFYGTAAASAARTQVNRWIRTQRLSDGIVDFDAAVRDPADPSRLRPAYDDGDHLHLTLAGYRAMAAAVPLERLAAPACP